MVSLKREKTPTGFCYRLRWREGGRDSPAHSRRFDNKRDAVDEMAAIEAQLAANKGISNRAIIPWAECCARYLADKEKPYARQVGLVLKRHTEGWRNVQSATPALIQAMPPGAARIVKACLRWADIYLNQPVDRRALAIAGTKVRPNKAKPDLLSDEEVARLMTAAAETGDGNGAIVHIVATYGHRAENLVQLTAANFPGTRILFRVKGGDEVTHPLLSDTLGLLGPLIEDHPTGPLFLNHLGKPWKSGQEFASWFNHFFGVGYYQLKRAAISRWFARGVDAKTIASITGHRTVSLLLDTYAVTNESRQSAALDALRERPEVIRCARVCLIDLPDIAPKRLSQ